MGGRIGTTPETVDPKLPSGRGQHTGKPFEIDLRTVCFSFFATGGPSEWSER